MKQTLSEIIAWHEMSDNKIKEANKKFLLEKKQNLKQAKINLLKVLKEFNKLALLDVANNKDYVTLQVNVQKVLIRKNEVVFVWAGCMTGKLETYTCNLDKLNFLVKKNNPVITIEAETENDIVESFKNFDYKGLI